VDVDEKVSIDEPADQFSIGEKGGLNKEVVQLMKPHWTLWKAWVNDRPKFDGCDIFMAFHLDRRRRRH
jgi:hypothetical protein